MKNVTKIVFGSLMAALIASGAAEAAEGWTRSAAWLRAGPGTSYPAVARVPAGASVSVHGCSTRWSWCDVDVGGERGWFPGSRIVLLRDGRRVALPATASLLGLAVLGFERSTYWNHHYRDRRFDDRRFRDRHRDHGYDGREGRPPFESRPLHREPRRPDLGGAGRPERMEHRPRPRVDPVPRRGVMPMPDAAPRR